MVKSKIQITPDTSAILEVEKEATWFLEINNKKIKVSATTILCLLTAERSFKAYFTGFYEDGSGDV
jgi:hypothetical protein